MNINLHIERIILDGMPVSPRQHARLRAAIAEELATLLAEGGVGPDLVNGGDYASLRTAPVHFAGGGPVEAYGRQIARAVYSGIGDSGGDEGSS